MPPRVLNAAILSTVVAAAYLIYAVTRIYGFDLYMEEFGPEKTMRVARVSVAGLFGVTFASSLVGGSFARTSVAAPILKIALAGLLCFLLGGPLFDLFAGITADAVTRTAAGILTLVLVVASPGVATWWLASPHRRGYPDGDSALAPLPEGPGKRT